MKPKDTLQSIESKKMKPADYVYLGVILLLCIITAVIFFISTDFVIKNINKIFLPAEQIATPSLDMPKYEVIKKRLNLPSNSSDKTTNTPIATQILPTDTAISNTAQTNTTTVNTPVVVASVLDKKLVKIEIINSTLKNGVAALLSKKLETAGFSKTTTISKTAKTIGTTTISIKNSKKEYRSFIEEVVKKSYSKAITKINPESSKFDVIITIGK